MTFTLFWILCTIVSCLGLGGYAAWVLKHPAADAPETLTLHNMLTGAFLAVTPVLNFAVILVLAFYFYSEIAPQIVLFGKKK